MPQYVHAPSTMASGGSQRGGSVTHQAYKLSQSARVCLAYKIFIGFTHLPYIHQAFGWVEY
jgi:hypothetical protein